MTPFGVWAPSQANHYSGMINVAEGVYPLGAQDWQPFKQHNHYSDALPSAPIGAEQVQKTDGQNFIYAGGTTGLYRLNTASQTYSWDNVTGSLSFSLTGEDPIDFVPFGDDLMAFNANLGGVAQADIGSGNFSILADAPASSSGGVFADRLWAIGQEATPNRVEFSAPNRPDIWGDYSRGADYQVLPTGGPAVAAAASGNVFVVFQEDAINVFARDPGPNLVIRQTLREKFGSPSINGVVSGPEGVYFLSEDGFYVVNGQGIRNIGAGVVDEWFFSSTQADLDKLYSIQGAHDPANKFILWRYGTPGFSGAGHTNKVIGYCYGLNRWFGFDLDCAWLLRAASPGLSLESLTGSLDDMTVSFDSRTWAGGRPQLAAIDSSFRFGFFDGLPMACTIETADLKVVPDQRSAATGFLPILQGTNTYTGQFGRKDTPTSAVTWNAESGPNRAGAITQRVNGRYIKARLKIPAGESWSSVSGIELLGEQGAGAA